MWCYIMLERLSTSRAHSEVPLHLYFPHVIFWLSTMQFGASMIVDPKSIILISYMIQKTFSLY